MALMTGLFAQYGHEEILKKNFSLKCPQKLSLVDLSQNLFAEF